MFHPRKFYNVTYWVYAVFPGHFNVTRLWCRRKPGKYRFWTKIPIALPWILIKGDGDYIIHNIGCLVTIINFISPLYCWKKVQTLKAEPFLWLVLALYRCTRNADCVWSLYSLDYLLLQVCSLFFLILSFYIRKKIVVMDFYENVNESNISASPTRMIQLGDKGNLQSEKQKKIIFIATNPIRDNELNLRTTNYYYFF